MFPSPERLTFKKWPRISRINSNCFSVIREIRGQSYVELVESCAFRW